MSFVRRRLPWMSSSTSRLAVRGTTMTLWAILFYSALSLMAMVSALSCIPCSKVKCPLLRHRCPAKDLTSDVCACCTQCAQQLNENCGGPFGSYGICSSHLECETPFRSHDPLNQLEGVCKEKATGNDENGTKEPVDKPNCHNVSGLTISHNDKREICEDLKAKHMSVRLVGGTLEEGLLEVFFNGTWGTVCVEGFGRQEAQVACRMLGFNSIGVAAVRSDKYGRRSGRHLLPYVICAGTEDNLAKCDINFEFMLTCSKFPFQSAAGVVCNIDSTRLYLTGTRRTTPVVGQVEIEAAGKRRTLCVTDDNIAKVVCNHLGLPARAAAHTEGWSFGGRPNPLLTVSFYCNGDEKNIFDCNQTVGNDCSEKPFGVVCSDSASLFLVADNVYPLIEGRRVVLQCATRDARKKAVNVTWPETAGGRPEKEFLSFDKLTMTHNGRLVRCVSSDGNQLLESSEILKLQVYYYPHITITRRDKERKPVDVLSNLLTTIQGQSVILWCEADSNPSSASITWSGRVNSTTRELQIISANKTRHNGVYTCTAVTKSVDDDQRLPLVSTYQLTVVVQVYRRHSHPSVCNVMESTFIFNFSKCSQRREYSNVVRYQDQLQRLTAKDPVGLQKPSTTMTEILRP